MVALLLNEKYSFIRNEKYRAFPTRERQSSEKKSQFNDMLHYSVRTYITRNHSYDLKIHRLSRVIIDHFRILTAGLDLA